MKTSSFKQAIEAQFDCLSKKVIKRAVKKGYRDMKRREKHECLFSDIPDYEQSRFGELDKYESDYTVCYLVVVLPQERLVSRQEQKL